jgi:hypothetical protein
LIYSEEISLAQWAVGLVARLEPLLNAGHMELVLAVLARQSWQRLVCRVKHTVTDEAVFHPFDLFVDVRLPEEDGRDDVSVSQLQQVLDR